MNAAFAQLLAFASALLLAIPPGTCMALAKQVEQKGASCCGESHCKGGSSQQETPSRPAAKCCCSQNAPLPADSVKAETATDLVLLMPVALGVSVALIRNLGTDPPLLDPGPPIQVLQCVWRC